MGKKIALEVQGEMNALHLIWTLLDMVLEEIPHAGALQQERYNTLVAVQEAATNVIRHAYKGVLSQPFRVEMELEGPRLLVTLVDQGPPFDPTRVENEPDENHPEEGGYGIFFMRSVMDRIQYFRRGETNVLEMARDFSPSLSPAGAPGEVRE